MDLEPSVMQPRVTSVTKGDQILLAVLTRAAAEVFVVNFKILHRATELAPPSVATEDLLAQPFVRNRV